MNFPTPTGISTYHTTPYPSISPTLPSLSAANKTVLITGGGQGLGLAFATHFAAASCPRIAITGRRAPVLAAAKKAIEKKYPGTRVLPLTSDVTDAAAVAAALEKVVEEFGKIDVLVNNAGFLPPYTPLGTPTSHTDWQHTFATNVFGTHNVLASFVASGPPPGAVLLNISTAAVNGVVPGGSAYGASKAAAVRVCESFAVENPGVRVVSVAPGWVRTEMHGRTENYFAEMGWGELPADDIELPASYIVWAASKEAEFLKGKFVWVHWDVTELKKAITESEDKSLFTLGVQGLPNITL
ncbi:NAD(P)-binding protein [Pyrenochaeta sp. DS3sAY3a]|nr:NAD(P)-binding protein [Pyrenochaeta sp. DS3sAY3a]